jgi:hypothetical protein
MPEGGDKSKRNSSKLESVFKRLLVAILLASAITAWPGGRLDDGSSGLGRSSVFNPPSVVGRPMKAAIRTLREQGYEILSYSRGIVQTQLVGLSGAPDDAVPTYVVLNGSVRLAAPASCPTFFNSCPVIGRHD